MKILLDESLPRKLKVEFRNTHEVFTVRDMGWLGQKNGALIKLMIEAGFEAFVTADRNLPYQQNLLNVPVTFFIFRGINNRRETYQSLIPKLLHHLTQNATHRIIEIS